MWQRFYLTGYKETGILRAAGSRNVSENSSNRNIVQCPGNADTKDNSETAKRVGGSYSKAGRKWRALLSLIFIKDIHHLRWCDNKKFQGYMQKKTSKRTVTLKGLSKRTTYFIKVRAYKASGNNKVYGKWSKVKRVKVKK